MNVINANTNTGQGILSELEHAVCKAQWCMVMLCELDYDSQLLR